MTMPHPLLTDPTAPSFDDPLGMMAACHRRIERQLATLSRLQRHLPENGCDADARAAARGILRYFDAAAPNHHADEEESLFPRLEQALAVRPVTLMAELEDEHARTRRPANARTMGAVRIAPVYAFHG